MLYLENSLTTSAFSKERMSIPLLLLSQAVSSIENANLYSMLARHSKTLVEQVHLPLPAEERN